MLLQSEPEPVGVEAVIREFVTGILTAIPKVALGVLFLAIAYVVIKVVVAVVRSFLERVYPESQQLVVDLWVALVGVFLWFGAALALLNVVGLGDVAASLGTASGFVGLGVAYALKEMIADTVAGVYLLRDPDFNEGDVVESASVTGEIVDIDLRKTRLRAEDGDLVVVANRDVEKKWRQDSVGPKSASSEHAVGD
ncbi:mechanosensitive ion channel family protein [Halorubellus salinus]|uniref:mechanosensitive ion channel family protein n=1 Tax=Halorubellus salinus TaxID=755309 RepID=UPI001D073BB3|nr:mechanosensitive ion channel domain-containing protein [Halorubellus salinus]